MTLALSTFGHGTATRDELAALLGEARLQHVVDVRRFPGSRHNVAAARGHIEEIASQPAAVVAAIGDRMRGTPGIAATVFGALGAQRINVIAISQGSSERNISLVVAEADRELFLAAGARGAAAIYTEHLTLIHIIRKVLLRVSSYLDYIIIKHGVSLH